MSIDLWGDSIETLSSHSGRDCLTNIKIVFPTPAALVYGQSRHMLQQYSELKDLRIPQHQKNGCSSGFPVG
jgi:hypothetical protein